MSEGPSRRKFLTFVGSSTAVVTAGCGGNSSESTVTETPPERTSTETPTNTPNQKDTETESEKTDITFNDISLAVDDPQTTSPRKVTISGAIDGDPTQVEVSISLNGELEETETVDTGTQFEITTEVAGGNAYTVGLVATDNAGTTETTNFETDYIAKPTTKVDENRLIGTHYYCWWGSGWHWDSGYDGEPLLGEYNSRDPEVIQQHFDWLREAGINWLSLSWWGRNSWSGETIEDHLLEADGIEDFNVSILYESSKMLTQDETGYRTNFNSVENQQQFISDIQYLSENLFNRDEHLYIEGKPVIYLYASSGYFGDFEKTLRRAEEAIDQELHVIGDFHFQKGPPVRVQDPDWFDSVSNYSAFYEAWENINELVPEQPRRKYTEWLLRTQTEPDLNFIPTVSASYDKTDHEDPESKELPILHGSPEKFKDWVQRTRGLMDPDLDAVLFNSFNEFHEGKLGEPTEEVGTKILDVIDSELREADFLHRNLDTISQVVLDYSDTIAEYKVNPETEEEFSRQLAFSVAGLQLANPETGWQKEYELEAGPESPYFIEGTFGYNPNFGRRWCGGSTGRAVLGFSWKDVSYVFSPRSISVVSRRDRE
ncbi:MAG: hypothetical protein ABEH81_09240, partial [Halopenitus sp.]